MKETVWIITLAGLLWGVWLPLARAASPMERLYLQASQKLKQRRYRQARQLFRRVLPLLQRAQQKTKPQTQPWHLLTLGQCDVFYHLAWLAGRKGKERRSCRYYHRLFSRLKTVPAGWTSWGVHPALSSRIARARRVFTRRCPAIPSQVILQLSPSQARVFLQTTSGWRLLSQRRFTTRQQRITLQLRAPGYQTRIFRNISIPRWQRHTMILRLSPRPSSQPATRSIALQSTTQNISHQPTSPPPPLWYKTWWFWTGVGLVVAGAVTATTLALTAQQRAVFPQKLWPSEKK